MSKNPQDLTKISSLDDYIKLLLISLMYIKLMEETNIQGFKAGILQDDETETNKTILWEIKRLGNLICTMISQIAERGNIDPETIVSTINAKYKTNLKFNKPTEKQ